MTKVDKNNAKKSRRPPRRCLGPQKKKSYDYFKELIGEGDEIAKKLFNNDSLKECDFSDWMKEETDVKKKKAAVKRAMKKANKLFKEAYEKYNAERNANHEKYFMKSHIKTNNILVDMDVDEMYESRDLGDVDCEWYKLHPRYEWDEGCDIWKKEF